MKFIDAFILLIAIVVVVFTIYNGIKRKKSGKNCSSCVYKSNCKSK